MNNQTSRKLRILQLISGDLWAGAEVMAFNLLRSLKDFPDLDIQVLLLNHGRLADELKASGLNVHIIDERRYSFWQIFRKTQAIIGKHQPDIIHSHRYKENLLAFLVSRSSSRKIKLITTQHGLPESAGKQPSIASRCKSIINFYLLSRYFDKSIAVSNDIRNTLINLFKFADGRIEVIHNGIRLPPAPSLFKDKYRPLVVGSSGRLFPVKDYPLMIEIAKTMVKSDEKDIRFELAGDGPERSVLEGLIEQYGLNNRFLLKGHQDDMDAFYKGLGIYINTSVHEGIPMTILEAMSHGLPVIAPAVGGIKEIYDDGSEGFLIEGRNPQDFAEKCLQLFSEYELMERMSRFARKRVEQFFSSEKMAEKLLSHVCSNSPPRNLITLDRLFCYVPSFLEEESSYQNLADFY